MSSEVCFKMSADKCLILELTLMKRRILSVNIKSETDTQPALEQMGLKFCF